MNLNKNEVIWQLDYDFRPITKDKFQVFGTIGRKRDSIICIDNNTGTELWKTELNDIAINHKSQLNRKIIKQLGTNKEILILYLSEGKILLLNKLDYSNKSKVILSSRNKEEYKFSNNVKFNQESSSLIHSFSNTIEEYKLNSQNFERIQLDESINPNSQETNIIINHKKIYLIKSDSNTIYEFDRQTGNTKNILEVGKSTKFRLNSMKSINKSLYIMNQENTLFVFDIK